MAENDLGKGVAKFIAKIKAGLEGSIKDQVSKAAAQMAADLIRDRTRQGYGVANDGGSKFPLAPLSLRYVERRKRSALSPFTSPSKSNLTFSGAMLESLSIKRSSPGNWLVILQGSHPTAGIENSLLARYVSRKRPFMFLSGGEVEQIRNTARKTFQDLVKQQLSR